MTPLTLLLAVKIFVTALAISIPFLFFSNKKLAEITQVQATTPTLFRLYGVAVTALLVAYGFGLNDSLDGNFPMYAVVMGIVSNGGGVIVLLKSGAWSRSLFLTAFFAAIAILLLLAIAMQDLALKQLVA